MVALIQCAYEKELMGKESLQMQTLSRCKKRTDLDGPASYSVPSRAVYGREWKFCSCSKLPPDLYNACTNARCISKGSYGEGELKNVSLESV